MAIQTLALSYQAFILSFCNFIVHQTISFLQFQLVTSISYAGCLPKAVTIAEYDHCVTVAQNLYHVVILLSLAEAQAIG